MRRAILRVSAGLLLGLAIYAADTGWGLAHLPPADNWCTSVGGTLEPDPPGWACNYHVAPVTPSAGDGLVDRGADR